jgi:anti-sigma factor RsiW
MTTAIHEVSPEEIMAHHDGEVPADRAAEISAHVEACVECRDLSESVRTTSHSLAMWSIGSAPPSIQPSFDASALTGLAVARRSATLWRQLRTNRIALGSAVAFCVVILALIGTTAPRSQNKASDISDYARNAAHSVAKERKTLAREEASKNTDEGYRAWLTTNAPASAPAPPLPPRMQIQNAEIAVAQSPMIAHTAQLQIVATKFDTTRAAVESILARYHGYAASLNVGEAENSARTLNASLRIPSQDFPAALAELKNLGHVTGESQAGEEVTAEHADLVARLKNSRETETRLQDILRTRTGKVSDILEVEQEIARVRGEIEQMESDLKSLNHRVDYATMTLAITEEYKAKVSDSTPGIATRFHNAAVAGLKNVRDSAVGLALSCAEFLPPLVFWLLILATPVAVFWRLRRRAIVAAASPLA